MRSDMIIALKQLDELLRECGASELPAFDQL
jgi:hypothetical protein